MDHRNVNSGPFSKSIFPYILHSEGLGFVNQAVALTPHTPTGNSRRHPYCSIRLIVRSTRIVQPLRQLIAFLPHKILHLTSTTSKSLECLVKCNDSPQLRAIFLGTG
ncbi:hypothetical protein XU18_5084 [Perkinsela sp. CCAP 1560/4]|nr:hypothetical protein XU18_5084 [Perkinsela sp. CCAP 1560/4]|eukprot:KNH02031.1 hypothetical protein XU18_5084 [Perkinsela sp. CCAP 1560/4]